MRILILEGTRSSEIDRRIASYVDVGRVHGDVEISILTRNGVADLPGVRAIRSEIALLEEVDDFYGRGVLERRAASLLETERYDLIFAPREGDIIRAARLREKYGIRGQTVASAIAYRDKLTMKELLHAAGVRVWPSRKIDDAVDYWDAIDAIGFPAVLKPRREYGTENVVFIHTEAEAIDAATKCFARLPVDVPAYHVLESFTGADMCHVDGIWHDGEPYYTTVSSYYGFAIGRPLDGNKGRACGSYMMDPASDRGSGLISLVYDGIRALPSAHTFPFHAEVWEASDGALHINEIAARIGGSVVHSNAVAAIGAEPDAVWMSLLMGVDPRAVGYVGEGAIRPCAAVGIPYRSGHVVSIANSCDLASVLDWKLWPNVIPGSTLPPQRHWFENLGIVTIAADTYAKISTEIDRVISWANASIVISP